MQSQSRGSKLKQTIFMITKFWLKIKNHKNCEYEGKSRVE